MRLMVLNRYFGLAAKVHAMEEFTAQTESQLLGIIEEYKGLYPTCLTYANLRFRLKRHRCYKLVPVECGQKDGCY